MQMLLRNHAAMPLKSRNYMRSIVHTAVAALRTPGSGEGHTTVKRKIALHLGYVGTNYKGLQFQRDSDQEGIEDILEQAIAKSGGILPSNVGFSGRTRWSRSSRTDKGVHSISTVVALKMECHDEFEVDQEGQAITAEINRHLPPEIRVFSAQRTQSSFSARFQCQDRTYQYFLPAKILGLNGSSDDVAIMDRFQAALAVMKGKHAFHNYTERKRYRQKDVGESAARDKDAKSDVKSSSEGAEELAQAQTRKRRNLMSRHTFTFRWIKGRPGWEGDRIGDAHFRTILDSRARLTDPAENISEPCVYVSLQGASFMVYQIRHILGIAIAVANDLIPLDFVEASLSVHTRCSLPKAPASTLVLSDSTFFPFPIEAGAPHPVCSISGPSLALRCQGQARQAQFCHEVLNPALDELLTSKEWVAWLEDLQSFFQHSKDDLQELLTEFQTHTLAARIAREERERSRLRVCS